MELLRTLYAKFRAAWPVNRIMMAITPVVTLLSAAASGTVVAWVAANAPGLPPIDPNWLAGIFTTSALGGAYAMLKVIQKWFDGHLQYERMLADPMQKPFAELPTLSTPGKIVGENGQLLIPVGDTTIPAVA